MDSQKSPEVRKTKGRKEKESFAMAFPGFQNLLESTRTQVSKQLGRHTAPWLWNQTSNLTSGLSPDLTTCYTLRLRPVTSSLRAQFPHL